MREREVETDFRTQPNDSGFIQLGERRVNAQPRASFDAGLGGEVGQVFKGRYELRPAVGITGIVDRIDADKNIRRLQHLRPGHGEGKKNRVARGNVGDRNPGADLIGRIMLGYRQIGGQSAGAEDAEVDFRDLVLRGVEKTGDARGRGKLNRMALSIVEREGVTIEPIASGDAETGRGIESAA